MATVCFVPRQDSFPVMANSLVNLSCSLFFSLPRDRNWSVTSNWHHLSVTSNKITAKLTNQFKPNWFVTIDWQQLFTWLLWWRLALRYGDVSHHYRQQFFSGLASPGRSDYYIKCYPSVQIIYEITDQSDWSIHQDCIKSVPGYSLFPSETVYLFLLCLLIYWFVIVILWVGDEEKKGGGTRSAAI